MGKLSLEHCGNKYMVVEDMYNDGTISIVRFEGTLSECQNYLSKRN